QGLGGGIFAHPADDDFIALDFEAGAGRQLPVELALGPFHVDLLALHFHLHFGRNGNRLFSNTGHKILPDVAEQFSAEVFLARLRVREQAFGRGPDRHTQTAPHTRNFRRTLVTAQTGAADALEAFNHALLAVELQADLQLLFRIAFHRHVRDIAFAL